MSVPKKGNRMTAREAAIIVEPIRRSLLGLRADEAYFLGDFPAMIDWKGEWSRIDEALLGWVECWQRFGTDIDIGPMRSLRDKLAKCELLTVAEIDGAMRVLRQQQKALSRLPRDFIKRQTDTELISIELERLGIKEAA